MTRHLVTGASGFIGAHTVRRLLDAGEDVVAFDRDGRGALESVLDDRAGDLDLVVGEITDVALLAHVVRDRRIERIIHLAAELHARSAVNPGQCIQSNVVGTHAALEAARLFDVERVVTASSAAIFGSPNLHPGGRVTNDARQHAGDVYEASKIFGESLGEHYFRTYGLDNAAIRVGLAYGFGCLSGAGRTMIEELLEKPLRGEPGRVPWGDSSINWTYIEDAAAAFVRAAEISTTDTFAYNLRGDHRPIRDAVLIARELLPEADIRAEPGEHPWAQDFDDGPLRHDTGFTASWSLEAGLRDTLHCMLPDPPGMGSGTA